MAEKYRLKTPKKIENTVVKGYKSIENGLVGTYKKIEDTFVEAFLEKVPEEEAGPENKNSK